MDNWEGLNGGGGWFDEKKNVDENECLSISSGYIRIEYLFLDNFSLKISRRRERKRGSKRLKFFEESYIPRSIVIDAIVEWPEAIFIPEAATTALFQFVGKKTGLLRCIPPFHSILYHFMLSYL